MPLLRPRSVQARAMTRPGKDQLEGGGSGWRCVVGSPISSGSNWRRGTVPAASVGPVGVGVAGWVGFGAGRAEWTGDEAATGRALVNGNVCAKVAAISSPPISATAAPAAISPRRRTDHELLKPPDDG